MNVFLIAAAVLSLGTCLLHVLAGGRHVAAPLLRARDLRPVPKFTSYYCWHMVSIVLAAMAIGFAYVAWTGRGPELAVLMTALAAAFALWNLVLVPWKRQSLVQMPQWSLFLGISGLGLAGLAG